MGTNRKRITLARGARGAALGLALTALWLSPSPAAEPARAQIPIDDSQWGLYTVTYQLASDHRRVGHVVVRGSQAAGIPGIGLQAGFEHWFFQGVQLIPGTPGATIRLDARGAPGDGALVQQINQVVHTEQFAGSYPVQGTWTQGGSVPGGTVVFQLESVSGGPAGRTYPIHQLALDYDPSGNGDPTIFAANEGVQTIFGALSGTFPFSAGCTAHFTEVTQGQPGYPEPGWVWTNHSP